MKIAVCFSGQQRPYEKFTKKQHIESAKFAFKDFDVEYFYHTWKNNILYEFENMLIEEEPIVNYHPIYDTTVDGGKSLSKRRIKRNQNEKLKHGTKQILAHSSLVKHITNDYDLIIRCRWDLYFSDKFDYANIIRFSYENGPVGLGYPKYDPYYLHHVEPQKRNTENIRWDKMISPDNMIIHRPKRWDCNLVDHLHKTNNLLPAEWGWYQILCAPFKTDDHFTYKGGVVCMSGMAGGWRPNKK